MTFYPFKFEFTRIYSFSKFSSVLLGTPLLAQIVVGTPREMAAAAITGLLTMNSVVIAGFDDADKTLSSDLLIDYVHRELSMTNSTRILLSNYMSPRVLQKIYRPLQIDGRNDDFFQRTTTYVKYCNSDLQKAHIFQALYRGKVRSLVYCNVSNRRIFFLLQYTVNRATNL